MSMLERIERLAKYGWRKLQKADFQSLKAGEDEMGFDLSSTHFSQSCPLPSKPGFQRYVLPSPE
jgi:hypothetical protein